MLTMLQSEKVTEIFFDCLYLEGEDSSDHMKVEGILAFFGLNPKKVENYKDVIKEMVYNLPVEFEEGWSFSNICFNRHMEQWTGLHKVCEQLVVLGIAAGRLEYILPREMWKTLPGQLPYLRIIGEEEYNAKRK